MMRYTIRQRLAEAKDRAVCVAKGHKWDSDRPSGPIHVRDICWRCGAIND